MATDLDVTTAAWGSANLLLASGDDISGATGYGWGSQVAQNTGWLYYQFRPLLTQICPEIGATRSSTFSMGYTYCPAGTYSIYGHAVTNKSDAPVGTLTWDGSNLVVFSGNTAATGSKCGWGNATARWVQSTVVGSANSAATLITVSAAIRFGSYVV